MSEQKTREGLLAMGFIEGPLGVFTRYGHGEERELEFIGSGYKFKTTLVCEVRIVTTEEPKP